MCVFYPNRHLFPSFTRETPVCSRRAECSLIWSIEYFMPHHHLPRAWCGSVIGSQPEGRQSIVARNRYTLGRLDRRSHIPTSSNDWCCYILRTIFHKLLKCH